MRNAIGPRFGLPPERGKRRGPAEAHDPLRPMCGPAPISARLQPDRQPALTMQANEDADASISCTTSHAKNHMRVREATLFHVKQYVPIRPFHGEHPCICSWPCFFRGCNFLPRAFCRRNHLPCTAVDDHRLDFRRHRVCVCTEPIQDRSKIQLADRSNRSNR